MSDNDRQFDSWEFRQLAEKLDIKHITNCLRCQQSNGHAEDAVKTVKKFFKKEREVGHKEYQAFLDWRLNRVNTQIKFSKPTDRLIYRE